MNIEQIKIYPESQQERGDSEYCIVCADGGAAELSVSGPDMELFSGVETTLQGRACKLCPLTVENSRVIRRLFGYTNPVSHKGHDITIGLGDRLGLASAGHIRLIRDMDVFPVLAQQSMRELSLTGRTYDDVLAAAVWAVFRERYTKGYGADGDHLKTVEEIKTALNCGYTMITLDCSEHIRNDLASAAQGEIDSLYAALGADVTVELEDLYLRRTFCLDGGGAGGDNSIAFKAQDFRRIVLVYLPAVQHALNVYNAVIKGTNVDFEISIDETLTATSPQSHFFVAGELIRRGAAITSVAPRFTGEFQKGIDYRGDIPQFEREFQLHAGIAAKLGYKLSVHSGSDKFSVFPSIGRLAGGRYHIKTAGTNWLEAVRVIASCAPALYRELHAYALDSLSDAKRFYHITENTANIADIGEVSDERLPDYLEHDDARQVLHVTYGAILRAAAPDGSPLFRDRIYSVLYAHEDEYFAALGKHIGRHLNALGITARAGKV